MKSDFGRETYILDKIPFEAQRVIDEIVDYWQIRHEPRDLAIFDHSVLVSVDIIHAIQQREGLHLQVQAVR